MSWKPEFQVVNDGAWYDNALRFETQLEATLFAADKMIHWTATTDSRVVESEDPANYAWSNATGLVPLPKKEKTNGE
jgi:hypothetical protein